MKKNLLFIVVVMFLTVSTTAQNAISNGDFEEQGAWKITTMGKLTVDDAEIVFGNSDDTPKYGEGNNLLVTWGGLSSFWELFIYQTITLEVGKTYKLSGAFKDLNEGVEDYTRYWVQIVMMPKNGYEDFAENGPQWSTFGVNASILYAMGHNKGGYSNEGGIGKDTTLTFGSTPYEGVFTGKYHSNSNQGDTTIFTIPASYPTASGDMELGEDGDEVDFYFIMYFGEGSDVTNNFAFTFDEFSIQELVKDDAIEQINTSNNFSLYPNPVKETLSIKAVNNLNSVSILNIVGEEVIKIKNIRQSMATINTSGLNKGIYLVRAIDDNGKISSKKMVKQ